MTPTRMWIAEVNGRSVGFLQDYRIGDYPEYAVLGPDPDAIGVDYALAEEWSGRGFGVRVLWAWMARAQRRFPAATSFFAAPELFCAPELKFPPPRDELPAKSSPPPQSLPPPESR